MNKPVAYVKQGKLGLPTLIWNPEISFKYECVVVKNADIPLYTHPAELTDEEIIDITIRWFGSSRNDFFPEQWLDYARAILRKAQLTCNGFCGEYECKENKTNCLRKAQEK